LARLNFGRDPSPSQVALTRDLVNGTRVRVSAELILQILRFDDVASLEAVDLPATVVVGTRDLVTPVRHGRILAEAVGGAELIVLDGCGHMVMLERPGELQAAIVALAERSAPARVLPRAPVA
ncbi:MAG: alpha/beta fold hydrolase, partial [Acidimicrobiales bacterium]